MKSHRQAGSRRPSLMMAVFLIPAVLFFFICGVYIGSKFVDGDSVINQQLVPRNDQNNMEPQGLPGTNNIVRRWSEGKLKYLRGAAMDVARRAELLIGLSPPARLTHLMSINGTKEEVVDESSIENHKLKVLKGLSKPLMPNSMYNHVPEPQHISAHAGAHIRHTVSGSQQKEQLKNSLHATERSYMVGPNSLDSSNILVGAWVYLDESPTTDNDMRTIFTNKKSGCENQKDQYGLSMYVNAWQTSDHRLYVEYGGRESGCHKLDSSGVQLHPAQWYHVAVHLGEGTASLFIDGTIVNSNEGTVAAHEVQTERPLRVGQYDDATFPLHGNISHLAFVHCHSDWTATTVGNAVKSMMDISLVKKIKGLRALYTFTDAVSEVSKSAAAESMNALDGVYYFSVRGMHHTGVPIDLIDGVNGRIVTSEMKEESDAKGRVRRESVKDAMKHAWSGYKTYAWGKDEVKPLSKSGSDPWGGMGVTLVDSLDTLFVMGMKEEFAEATQWVEKSLSFKHADTVSVFEVWLLPLLHTETATNTIIIWCDYYGLVYIQTMFCHRHQYCCH